MLTVKVYDTENDEVVYTFEATAQNIAMTDDLVWVPQDNAPDVGYYIHGRQFDYELGEVRLVSKQNPEIEKPN